MLYDIDFTFKVYVNDPTNQCSLNLSFDFDGATQDTHVRNHTQYCLQLLACSCFDM
jgi:hypothetical protein